jgi:hypothetical protein
MTRTCSPTRHCDRAAIAASLRSGDATLRRTAPQFGGSERSLQRRLAELGTTTANWSWRFVSTRPAAAFTVVRLGGARIMKQQPLPELLLAPLRRHTTIPITGHRRVGTILSTLLLRR